MMNRVMTSTFTTAPVSINISTGPWGNLRSIFAIDERINSLGPLVNIKTWLWELASGCNTKAVTLQ